MKRREDGAVREVMKRLLRSNLRFHKTDCGRFGAMTAWGLKDTSSRPAKDLGGTLRHTYITNLLYAGVGPKTVQYVTVNEVNSNQKFDLIRKSILSILQTKNAYDIIPSLTVAEIKNRCIPCVYWGTAIFVVVMKYSNLFFSFAFFLDRSHFAFGYELIISSEAAGFMKIICNGFTLI